MSSLLSVEAMVTSNYHVITGEAMVQHIYDKHIVSDFGYCDQNRHLVVSVDITMLSVMQIKYVVFIAFAHFTGVVNIVITCMNMLYCNISQPIYNKLYGTKADMMLKDHS